MMVPPRPAPHFIFVQARLALGLLEAGFDRPAQRPDPPQRPQRGVGRGIRQVMLHLAAIPVPPPYDPGRPPRQAVPTFPTALRSEERRVGKDICSSLQPTSAHY